MTARRVDGIDYTVNPQRAGRFYHLIRHYWPGLPDGALSPAYSGAQALLVYPQCGHDAF